MTLPNFPTLARFAFSLHQTATIHANHAEAVFAAAAPTCGSKVERRQSQRHMRSEGKGYWMPHGGIN